MTLKRQRSERPGGGGSNVTEIEASSGESDGLSEKDLRTQLLVLHETSTDMVLSAALEISISRK